MQSNEFNKHFNVNLICEADTIVESNNMSDVMFSAHCPGLGTDKNLCHSQFTPNQSL